MGHVKTLEEAEPWAPHAKVAPLCRREGSQFSVKSNGTRLCSGGWQFSAKGIEGGVRYRLEVPLQWSGFSWPRDGEKLKALVFWGRIGPGELLPSPLVHYDALTLVKNDDGTLAFSRELTAPANAREMTLRLSLRWTDHGEVAFGKPMLAECPEKAPRKIRIALATGNPEGRRGASIKSIEDNVSYYLRLAAQACSRPVDLVVLPEIALQWGLGGQPFEHAVPLGHPAVKSFQDWVDGKGVHLLLPFYEREGDAICNTAALLRPEGKPGIYRKVHLAECSESLNGILPGDGFPVFHTGIGRIGSLICMDSSNAEASRMLGLGGAEVMLLPIMGDHRGDRFTMGSPVFHEERWKAIMRTRALDNQFVVAVARNDGLGSCVIDAKGDILAWNDGTEEVVWAEAALDPDHRKWNGGSQRDIVWTQRRPQLYENLATFQEFPWVH